MQSIAVLCSLPAPLKKGELPPPSCYAYFVRYRYNPDTNKCEEFVYGGCGGNKNNYLDEKACEQTCVLQ